MATVDPMNNRADALFRVLLLLYLVFIWPIVSAIGIIAGLLFMIVDVVVQLIWGTSGLSTSGGFFSTWSARLFQWPLDQLSYIIGTDKGGFPLLP